MAIVVRRATKDDAAIVADYAMKLVEQHTAYDALRFARLSTLEGMQWFYGGQTEVENAAVLVAELDRRVIGFAYVGYEERNYAELSLSSAWLHDVYVDEAARHAGAGRVLIEAAVEVAKSFGASKLLLSVAARNAAAQGFFEHAGFRTTMHEMMLDLTGE